jgi:hypothetical protein
MPAVREITVPEAASLAIAVEGETAAFDGAQATTPTLSFDSINQQSRWIDIINRGQAPFDFSLESDVKWIKTSAANGKVEAERRIEVTVDWDEVPTGATQGSIKIVGVGGEVIVNVAMLKPADLTRATLDGFVERDGCTSIEAEHFTKKVDAPQVQWDKLDDFGRTLSAMSVLPMTAASAAPPANSPCLEYRMYLFDSGPVEIQAVLSPTLEFLPGRNLRYAVSFDDQPPQIVSALPQGRNRDNLPRDWDASVRDAVRVSKSKHTLEKAGYHVLKFWMVDAAVVLQRIVVDRGGIKPSYLGPPGGIWKSPGHCCPAPRFWRNERRQFKGVTYRGFPIEVLRIVQVGHRGCRK